MTTRSQPARAGGHKPLAPAATNWSTLSSRALRLAGASRLTVGRAEQGNALQCDQAKAFARDQRLLQEVLGADTLGGVVQSRERGSVLESGMRLA